MPQLGAVISIAILLGAALVGGMIAHRLRQPVLLGYLLVGVAIGPYALGLVREAALIEASATIGVALLMFTLGLEISIAQLKRVGKIGLWGGIAQILLTFALGLIVGNNLFRWTFSQAALFGLVISLSSTMVCLKILMERGELDSVHGRIMVALLILQDISVVLMVVVMPMLGGAAENLLLALALALGKALLFIGLAIVLGLWVLPWLMGRIGGVRSRELFLLTVMVLSLGAALGTYLFGLSAIFGAFVIGLVLRESRFAHQALAEITPLRDIFATLFFVSLGMLLNPRFVLANWWLIILTVAIIIFIKFVVVFGVVRFFGYNLRIAFLVGAGLFQIGEFGFILAQTGLDMGIISDQFYSLVLASAVVTMILTPFSLSSASWLYAKLTRMATMVAPVAGKAPVSPSQGANLVVIAGYGRVGQNIVQGLKDAALPYTVIEIDPERIAECQKDNSACIYGDASNVHVLTQANLSEAKALVVTFPDPLAVVTIVKTALSINPKLKIVVRVHQAKEAALLKSLGVTELVNPEYEASFEFLRRVLTMLGWQEADQRQALAVLRQDRRIAEFTAEEES